MTNGTVTADGRARVLADGNEIPLLGLGVWQVPDGPECENAVRWALELGYRHIDTAQAYGNERERRPRAARQRRAARRGLRHHQVLSRRSEDPEAEAQRSLERLGVDHVDLYIIHWPQGGPTWAWDGHAARARARATRARSASRTSASPSSTSCSSIADVRPVVNQVQFSPFEYRRALLEACEERGDRARGLQPARHRPAPRRRARGGDRRAPRPHAGAGADPLVPCSAT